MGFYSEADEAIKLLKQARDEAEAIGYSPGKKDNDKVTIVQEKLRKAALLAIDASKSLQKFISSK